MVAVLVGVNSDTKALTMPIALRRELVADGWNDSSLAAAVKRGELARSRRGAYVDGSAWLQLDGEERYVLKCRSALRQAKTDSFLSHVSSLPFLGAPLWGYDLGECHLTRTDGRPGRRREASVRQHQGVVGADDIVTTSGVDHSSPVRAAIEVTTVAGIEPALVSVCHLLNSGQATIEQIRDRYDRYVEHWPGTRSTELVLRLADPRLSTIAEVRSWHFFWRHSLPKPIPQFHVVIDSAEFWLDFALPDYGVWFEFDGKEKYLKYRRPGESVADAVVREKNRENLIAEHTGLRCFRIVWADLAYPDRLEKRIRVFIESVRLARARARR